MVKLEHIYKKIVWLLPILLLILYSFRKVRYGIDVTDTGYHFSNFMYMQNMDPMWIFATYLSSYLGYLITLLPGGTTLLFMNIYTSILPMLMSVGSYLFCVKHLHMHKWVAFVGNIIALSLCWCPTTCIYNYLTYFVFMLSVMCLYLALVKEQKVLLFVAGICLGLNVFVRFPNLAEIALIVVVWEAIVLKKETFKQALQKTGICVLGFVVGMLLVLIHIAFTYGIGEYIDGIFRLLSMSSDAEGYTLYEMIYSTAKAYMFSMKWVVYLVLASLAGMLGFMVFPTKFIKIKTVGLIPCFLLLFRWFYGQGMFNMAYDGYGSMFNWGVLLLIYAVALIVWITISKNCQVEEKICAGLIFIIIIITPLGSNNQLYSNLNNMVLIVPFVLHYSLKFCMLGAECNMHVLKKKVTLYTIPFKVAIGTTLFMAGIQIVLFGNSFVFRDTLEYGARDTKITSMDTLEGMYTSASKAEALESLGAFVASEGLKGRPVLLYGDVPALSAYLEMPFILSPWPDLASYTDETFETELAHIDLKEAGVVFLFSADFNKILTMELDNEQNAEEAIVKYGLKAVLIHDMIHLYDYKKVFDNGTYVIYE